jgi:membrane-bound lytic murein transglycosylase A
MRAVLYFFMFVFIMLGCVKKPEIKLTSMPKISLQKVAFYSLPGWDNEDYNEVLYTFINNCQTKHSQKIYADLCQKAQDVTNAKYFFENNFEVYKIQSQRKDPLLTGYYEPELHGSLEKSELYSYPVYETPNDLVTVDLSSIYPELKHYRLRGKIEGSKLIPFDKRVSFDTLDAKVICYVDSKIDLFFLEVQGSGRIVLDSGEVLYVGYDNQNGHKYKSIGKYLVSKNEIPLEDISLQSIKEWFKKHPQRVDEVLNYNPSMVFFQVRNYKAKGAFGLELTPLRSIAVDKRYIPLGSMLYMDAQTQSFDAQRVVFAQDTGGAIKGAVRADIFLGFGKEAGEIAGELKAPLHLWVLVPKFQTKRVK